MPVLPCAAVGKTAWNTQHTHCSNNMEKALASYEEIHEKIRAEEEVLKKSTPTVNFL